MKADHGTIDPSSIKVESFESADGSPAVAFTIPDELEMKMAPAAALALAARLGTAAVAAETFRVAGEVLPGPHDARMLAGIIGGALETLLGPRFAPPSTADATDTGAEQKP